MHFQVAPALPPNADVMGASTSDRAVLPKKMAERLVPNPNGYVPPKVAQWVNCDIRSFDYSVLGQ
jgi:hypothetical protein